jgi:uridine kinase
MKSTDPPRRVIVSICGSAGSGKTLLSKLLVDQLGPDVAVRVPGDRYLTPAREPLDLYLRRPVRYDWRLLDRDLDVLNGTAVLTPSFDFQRFARRDQPDRRPFITRPVLVVDAIAPYPAATLRRTMGATRTDPRSPRTMPNRVRRCALWDGRSCRQCRNRHEIPHGNSVSVECWTRVSSPH